MDWKKSFLNFLNMLGKETNDWYPEHWEKYEVIQNKRDEIYKEIDKVNKSGLSEKKRNTQIQNLQNQLPKDNDDLSKEY